MRINQKEAIITPFKPAMVKTFGVFSRKITKR